MITAYDVFNTLIHIIYGDDFEELNIHNTKGVSLFKYIDENNRTCDNYEELKKKHCRCY